MSILKKQITLSGIEISVSNEHFLKALSPFGIEIFANNEINHFMNVQN